MNKKKLPLLQEDKKPWYGEGLRFECTGCGQCCTGGPGYVWVSDDDIKTISAHLNISEKEFQKRYLRRIGDRYSLLEDAKSYDCVFLENNRCKIYQHRPAQCSTYPWWPYQIESKEAWDNAAQWCEGINSNAPLVTHEEIEKQLSIYQERHPHEE